MQYIYVLSILIIGKYLINGTFQYEPIFTNGQFHPLPPAHSNLTLGGGPLAPTYTYNLYSLCPYSRGALLIAILAAPPGFLVYSFNSARLLSLFFQQCSAPYPNLSAVLGSLVYSFSSARLPSLLLWHCSAP